MTAVEEFQTQTEGLSIQTQTAVLAVYAELTAGQINAETATAFIAGIINRANAAAVSLADTWLALQIEAQARIPVPTVGVLPVDDSERLLKAAATVLDEPDTAETRLTRIARAEPLEAAQQGTHDAMQEQPLVEGWVRSMDADPCELCVWWWREGRIWPKVHPFQSHKGCNCQPRVVLARNIKSTIKSRKLERDARAS